MACCMPVDESHPCITTTPKENPISFHSPIIFLLSRHHPASVDFTTDRQQCHCLFPQSFQHGSVSKVAESKRLIFTSSSVLVVSNRTVSGVMKDEVRKHTEGHIKVFSISFSEKQNSFFCPFGLCLFHDENQMIAKFWKVAKWVSALQSFSTLRCQNHTFTLLCLLSQSRDLAVLCQSLISVLQKCFANFSDNLYGSRFSFENPIAHEFIRTISDKIFVTTNSFEIDPWSCLTLFFVAQKLCCPSTQLVGLFSVQGRSQGGWMQRLIIFQLLSMIDAHTNIDFLHFCQKPCHFWKNAVGEIGNLLGIEPHESSWFGTVQDKKPTGHWTLWVFNLGSLFASFGDALAHDRTVLTSPINPSFHAVTVSSWPTTRLDSPVLINGHPKTRNAPRSISLVFRSPSSLVSSMGDSLRQNTP